MVSGSDRHLFLRRLVRTGSWAHKQQNPCLPASVYSGTNDRSENMAIQLYIVQKLRSMWRYTTKGVCGDIPPKPIRVHGVVINSTQGKMYIFVTSILINV